MSDNASAGVFHVLEAHEDRLQRLESSGSATHEDRILRIESVFSELGSSLTELNVTVKGLNDVCCKLQIANEKLIDNLEHIQKRTSKLEIREERSNKMLDWTLKVVYGLGCGAAAIGIKMLSQYIGGF